MRPFHFDKITELCRLTAQLATLPVARLHFCSHLAPKHVREVYEYFTKPHPKYKLIKNKSFGAALIDLRAFGSDKDFLASLQARGRATAERRRALKRGHYLRRIDRNQFIEGIHHVNTSCLLRQGQPMAPDYLEKQLHYEDLPHFRYYGMFDRHEKLIAYCNLGLFGSFAMIDRVIGLRNGDGAMYLLMTEIAAELIAERQLDYLMYDTFFGALPGLRDFKRRLGFQPYRARYTFA